MRSESGTNKRVLHRNFLLPCTYLPVEEADIRPKPKDNSRQQKRNPSSQNNKHVTQTTVPVSQDDEDDDIPSFTPNQLQVQHPETTVEHPRTEEQGTQEPVATSDTADYPQDVAPEPPVSDLHTEPEQPQFPTSQPVVGTRQPRIRRPSVRMTYDVPGQPKFYPGVTTNMVSAAPNPPPLWLSTPPQFPPFWYFPQYGFPVVPQYPVCW